ncbi:hypothetical protein SAMN04489729_5874 [Amycolatopsis lurida]|uniref:Lipoprotein n=1 Tax=Amycolatopsis lurida NRRL 2430 TaxID=1460371 RepID=A0A2P2FY10_AMYLU|nr:hypothetical protein [Amycolatopsis lurida]KFU81603.1 hypothetical protein BB31_09540 [Amycolatopsis lurida NRRL 2430]SED95997.1 hypothetical protein SAMN04489729_5874 [Amycolatopsis lurida]
MRKRPMAVLIAGAVLALVAGCGGGGDGGDKVASISSPPAPGAAGDGKQADNVSDEDKMRNYRKCMREHGIEMPEPKPDGSGQDTVTFDARDMPDEKKMNAASDACRKLLPNGGEIKPPTPEELDKMRKEAKCMREHGIDFPDPEPGGKGGAAIALGDANGDPKKFEEAAKACGLGMTMRAAPAK